MDPLLIGILAIVVMLILLALGVSVSTSIGISAVIGLMFLLPSAWQTRSGISPFQTIDNYNMAVLPMFALMAMIIMHTGVGSKLFDAFYKLVGRMPGGLAMASILACAIFAAISSSGAATAITVGLIALPEMQKAKYKNYLAGASIAAGGTLGPLIPPSNPVLNYCIMTGTSILTMFSAVVIPGIIFAVLYCITVLIICKVDPAAGPKGPKFTPREILSAFSKCGEILLLIIIVLGGMFAGLFTPTEAAAIGAAGSIIITLARRVLTWKKFVEAVKGAMKNCGMIYAIFIAAHMFNYVMALSRLPTMIANWVATMNIGPTVVVIVMVLILLVMGCFMDGLGLLVLTVPIFFPIADALGVDAVWFGVVFIICIQMCVTTPPVGMNLFHVKSLDPDNISLTDLYKGAYPFVAAQVVGLALLFVFPSLTSFLPAILRG